MRARHRVGLPFWASLAAAGALVAAVTLAVAATARAGGGALGSTAAKLRRVTAYQDVGFEPCYLCFARIKRDRSLTYRRLVARTVTRRGTPAIYRIVVCRGCSERADQSVQRAALENWRDVQILWVRESGLQGFLRPDVVATREREFRSARLAVPGFEEEPPWP